ncbi:MAG TPA: transposase [Thermodesulfobacteriota bacterium]|nr:transposase [Thermodesulfobacteriota bacterium]
MKTYDPNKQHRRSIRLKGYDYTQVGAYFVTICTQHRECLFGEVVDGEMQVNEFGQSVADCWQWLGNQYPYIVIDEWVVMPNHLHGIIVIMEDQCRGGSRTAPTEIKRKPLGQLIGAFKTVSTKRINEMRSTPVAFVWQRNYYEHIVRDEETFNLIRQYVADNPLNWTLDRENPLCDKTKDLKTQKCNKWEV